MDNSNKVLVKILLPEIDQSYDMYLPINRKVGNVVELINKLLDEIEADPLIMCCSYHIGYLRHDCDKCGAGIAISYASPLPIVSSDTLLIIPSDKC